MPRKAKIISPGYADHRIESEVLAPLGVTVETINWGEDRAKLINAVGDAELLFVRDTVLDAELINAMGRAKGIVRYGVGTDTIDIDAASARNVVVARVPDYGADVEVADHALALFLAVRRRVVTRDADIRKGAWQIGQAEPIRRIAGSVAGFVGYGRIARAVAQRLRGFGVTRILAFDPFLTAATAGPDVELVELETIARESNVISLHAPATEENQRLVNDAFLRMVKPDVILINTSRGALVDEAALASALGEGRVFGAGIDVFEAEPPTASPLLTAPRTVISDHTGWYSETTVENIQRGAAEQAFQILSTGAASEAVNEVNAE